MRSGEQENRRTGEQKKEQDNRRTGKQKTGKHENRRTGEQENRKTGEQENRKTLKQENKRAEEQKNRFKKLPVPYISPVVSIDYKVTYLLDLPCSSDDRGRCLIDPMATPAKKLVYI